MPRKVYTDLLLDPLLEYGQTEIQRLSSSIGQREQMKTRLCTKNSKKHCIERLERIESIESGRMEMHHTRPISGSTDSRTLTCTCFMMRSLTT